VLLKPPSVKIARHTDTEFLSSPIGYADLVVQQDVATIETWTALRKTSALSGVGGVQNSPLPMPPPPHPHPTPPQYKLSIRSPLALLPHSRTFFCRGIATRVMEMSVTTTKGKVDPPTPTSQLSTISNCTWRVSRGIDLAGAAPSFCRPLL